MIGESYKSVTTYKPFIDIEKNEIGFDIETKFGNMLAQNMRETIDLKNKAVQEMLIKMGWTPPS